MARWGAITYGPAVTPSTQQRSKLILDDSSNSGSAVEDEAMGREIDALNEK
jgi:hypothetical protein